jgi:hypothetical protein
VAQGERYEQPFGLEANTFLGLRTHQIQAGSCTRKRIAELLRVRFGCGRRRLFARVRLRRPGLGEQQQHQGMSKWKQKHAFPPR